MRRAVIEARAAAFAVAVQGFSASVRAAPGGADVARQLCKAACSAAANYRAAARARSRAEFTAKLGVANEEADEAVFWLEHIAGSTMAPTSALAPLLAEAKELRAIIAASYATARRNATKI